MPRDNPESYARSDQVRECSGKESACQGDARDADSISWTRRLLEEEMAIHSSILAWKRPWTEEPGGLQSMRLLESDTTERLCTRTEENAMINLDWGGATD